METDEPALLDVWRERWADLTEFEIAPVIKSAEAAERVPSGGPGGRRKNVAARR